jgi:hypothetical protein
MSELAISYYLEKLIVDASFLEQLENQIEDILSDGVINSKDIPKVIQIIVELIEKSSTIIIKQTFVSDVIKKLILFLVKKYNTNITETDLLVITDIIDSSLKLLFKIPVFKNGWCCK